MLQQKLAARVMRATVKKERMSIGSSSSSARSHRSHEYADHRPDKEYATLTSGELNKEVSRYILEILEPSMMREGCEERYNRFQQIWSKQSFQTENLSFYQDLHNKGRVDVDCGDNIFDQVGASSLPTSGATSSAFPTERILDKSKTPKQGWRNLSNFMIAEPDKVQRIMALLTDSKKNEIKR